MCERRNKEGNSLRNFVILVEASKLHSHPFIHTSNCAGWIRDFFLNYWTPKNLESKQKIKKEHRNSLTVTHKHRDIETGTKHRDIETGTPTNNRPISPFFFFCGILFTPNGFQHLNSLFLRPQTLQQNCTTASSAKEETSDPFPQSPFCPAPSLIL